MITIRCICTDKAQMRILRFSYLLQEKSCSKWGMVRLHSSFFRAENAQIIILFEIPGKGVAGRKGGQEA